MKPKAPKKPAAHPPTSEMVIKAIVTLKERSGSSLPAIKKYIAANYKVGPVGCREGKQADRRRCQGTRQDTSVCGPQAAGCLLGWAGVPQLSALLTAEV